MAENIKTVERYFSEVLDGGNFDVMPDLFHADAVMHRPGFDIEGLEQVLASFPGAMSVYTSFESRLSGFVAEGDLVSVRVDHRTRVKPHLMPTRLGAVEIKEEQDLNWVAIAQFRLSEGKIAEEWVSRDEVAMIQQVAQVTLSPLKP